VGKQTEPTANFSSCSLVEPGYNTILSQILLYAELWGELVGHYSDSSHQTAKWLQRVSRKTDLARFLPWGRQMEGSLSKMLSTENPDINPKSAPNKTGNGT